MGKKELKPCQQPLTGVIEVPGDKSISHRAVILGSLATGTTKVRNFLDGEDCMRTVTIFQSLGVKIEKDEKTLLIHGKGVKALTEPKAPLYFGNSGTTARLMIGVLAGLPLFTTVYGDPSLTKRPMDRVVTPTRQMGANFDGRENSSYLPLAIRGGGLTGISYQLPVKSAQVKSAVLLAGILADGMTEVVEQAETRNHTENMLQAFGANVNKDENSIIVKGKQELLATDIYVPGDISSAAFFFAAAAIVPGSNLTLKNVGLNETRTGIIDVLQIMGVPITIANQQIIGGEKIGDITISKANLTSATIEGDLVPKLIDEIPIIALLATQAEGTTIIRDAAELRVKETDRIAAVVDVLTTLGANIEATDDGMIIHGKTPLTGGYVRAYDDHRIAMMIAIASRITSESVFLDDEASIAISYPNFFADLEKAQQE
ncbi:3-phosphoshikimate 1-carboxyvinyltransferase [Lentibacillus sp. Marseille-P4043]|uniref:3-phosphoshikimate 1-carboxyvinyltransferase n=1 Tax=Lentibacillus sp. Marseille-P4043 TaxID=2040293 RepID=UPI000D0BA655|nr:3-phosphoshikimate 1-carboxyvinyltransferase [Lentibacillus sp. Marseille-P4043]